MLQSFGDELGEEDSGSHYNKTDVEGDRESAITKDRVSKANLQ